MSKKNFNLTIYQVAINTRGDKNDNVVLSDFHKGTDLYVNINTLLKSWIYIIQDEEEIKLQKDNEKVFRIMKINNVDQLFLEGRFISGIIESGDYGTEENIVNIITGKPVYTKKKHESVLIPFYFMFYIPEASKMGFLVIERIGNKGIYSILENKLRQHIAPQIKEDFVLKFKPVVIKKLVEKHLNSTLGGARKIIFNKVVKDDLHVSRLTHNAIKNEEVGSTELVYVAKRNNPFQILKWFEKLRNKESENVYVVEDIEYEDVSFEIIVDKKARKISVSQIEKLGSFMDITDNITLDVNNYPTYKSIDKEAHRLVTYFLEQIKNDNSNTKE